MGERAPAYETRKRGGREVRDVLNEVELRFASQKWWRFVRVSYL